MDSKVLHSPDTRPTSNQISPSKHEDPAEGNDSMLQQRSKLARLAAGFATGANTCGKVISVHPP